MRAFLIYAVYIGLMGVVGCAERFVGYHVEGVRCGYYQVDPDAESIQAVTSSLGDLAGTALRSAAGVPPAGFQTPRTPPLPAECTQAETCVHWEQNPQTRSQSCTVIRGGAKAP